MRASLRILPRVSYPGILRHPAFWLLPLLLAGYWGLAAPQLGAPLLWDEVNFFWNAQAIAETGVPYANAGFLTDRGAVGPQYQYGLWHPPLYLYTLGLGLKLFGASEAVARGVGVALMTLTALCVYLLGWQTIPPPARPWGALLAVAIFLVSPLVIQSALVLDIDGTVLTLLLAVWTLLYLRLEAVAGRRTIPALSLLVVVFALALWAKLTTPFALLAVLLVYQTLRGRPLRGLLHLGVIGLGGTALFAATWGLACWWLGLPFDMPLGVTWAELADALGGEHGALAERLETQALPILAWVSPYLTALFVGAAMARAVAFVRRRRLEPVDFLLGFGALVCLAYFIKLAAGFPKYHIAMMPFWAVVIAHWMAESWARLPRAAVCALLLLTAVGLGLAFAYAVTWLADSWMLEPRALEQPEGLGLGLLAGGLLGVAALARRPALVAPLTAGVVALYGGWAASADWYHTWVPYSTNYWYGTMGQREMAAVVDELLGRYGIDGPYIGAKEVVFYTHHQAFLDQDTVYWLWGEQGQPFDGRLFGYEIPLVVAWAREPWVRHIFTERLAEQYDVVAEVHDYLAFVRRSLAQADTTTDGAPNPPLAAGPAPPAEEREGALSLPAALQDGAASAGEAACTPC